MKAFRYVLFGLAALFLFTMHDFRTLVHNMFELRALDKQEKVYEKEYRELNAEKARLLNENDGYLEQLARTELNLTKPGEMEFRFPPPGGKK